MMFPIPEHEFSVDRIHKAVKDACDDTNDDLDDGGYSLRVGTRNDVSSFLALLDDATKNTLEQQSLVRDFELFHSIVLEQDETSVVGFAIVYLAYSTWDGRYLYLNHIVAPNNDLEASMMHCLSNAVVRLEGQRLAWRHYDDKLPLYNRLGGETLNGWLTLQLDVKAMSSFLSSRNFEVPETPTKPVLANDEVNKSIQSVLATTAKSEKLEWYLATEHDLPDVERLVDGLATYHKEVDVIHVNKEHYLVDGFRGGINPLYKCLLLKNKDNGHCCGMAFFYFGYDLHSGRFVFLEELFIEERYRGNGGGTLTMATLASIAKCVGCTALVWQALEWDTAALRFYDMIGAKVQEGLITTRFNGEALKQFVANKPPSLGMFLHPTPSKDLSISNVRSAIDEACIKSSERTSGDYVLRGGKVEDLPVLLSATDTQGIQSDLSHDSHLFHTIILEKKNDIVGFCIFYWAYSTWDGRFLYVNRISAPNDELEKSITYTLAEVAVRLDAQRLVWQHHKDKISFNKSLGAEALDGWLTLRMSQEDMNSFMSSQCMPTSGTSATDNEAILEALKVSNSLSEKLELHLSTANDLGHIERLVTGLAVYEKEPESVHVNQQHYRIDGFAGEDAPLFKCLLLKNKEDADNYCGVALFYFGYDLIKGRFLYLEDLFIEEAFRGRGGGSLIMATVASIAERTGCTGFVWQALDWNTPALNFYRQIGAKVEDGLLTSRFAGDALRRFVAERPSDI